MLLPMAPSVSVLGVVAAAHHSATQTGPKVDPGVTHGDTLVANSGTRFGDGCQIVQVVAGFGAHAPLIIRVARTLRATRICRSFGSDAGEGQFDRPTHIDLGEMALVLL